ncbi:hypothetical protein FACS189434_03330 [Bacteroidia bacterium]|nr:hypothetical protein FACS189434_03330 [Bacteroidia bacterium]
MKKLIVILIVLLAFSCKEKKGYEMRLLFENNTENNITVKLYPKNEYMHYDMYRTSDIGGGYNNTEFIIKTNENKIFFTSGNINQKPYDLTSNVFDSIFVIINTDSSHLIKFSSNIAVGYSENIFSENSIWDYRVVEEGREDMGGLHPVESHQFTFEVLVDKLVK